MNGNDILKMNPHVEELLPAARRCVNGPGWQYKKDPQPLVLLHISDIHGDDVELERVTAVREALGCVDDVICTGDLVPGRFRESFDYWNKCAGAEKILLAIGNHDALNAEEGWDWSCRATQKMEYDKYFAPYISGWNADCPGEKTYYFKDYPQKGVRLIVLNTYLQGTDREEEIIWLKETLENTRQNGITAVMADHFPPEGFRKFPCTFSSPDYNCAGEKDVTDFLVCTDRYIKDGGLLACWLAGHIHTDAVGVSESFPNQIFSVIDAASRWQSDYYTDSPRIDGTASQDVMNITVVDTRSHLLKLIRIGESRDRFMRSKKALTLDYLTGEIIWNE